MQPLGVWIFHDENKRVPLNTCKNAETKLPSNGGVPSTRRRHITNCAWSHNAPTVGYKTSWIMNHASFFTRATLIETVVYHKISFLLTASLTASSPFTDSVSFTRLLLSREQNNCWSKIFVSEFILGSYLDYYFFILGFVFPYFISLLVYLFFTIYIYVYLFK